ncbi:MAG TPA: CsbD family protein [Bryobacteraceae bacterium]|nr:CsbD family protein [Bryobacteraceae bacterium]
MKPSTKDHIKGSIHQVKGGLKEKVGQATNNAELKAEGQDEKLSGKIRKKISQIEKVFES